MDTSIPIRNPRNGKIDYTITPPTEQQLTDLCGHLRQHQKQWVLGGLQQRIEVLQTWKQAIKADQAELLEALITDTGRKSESILEIDSLISGIDRWCRLAPQLLAPEAERTTAIPFINLQHQSIAYPLVGVISPWNFPLLLSTIDTIPALMAGCAVIVKPSEIAPRFIQPLIKTISTVPLLRDVLAYIEGAAETGANLIQKVDLICFTGSVATGKKVAAAAAKQFIPAFLELGGKDAAIVLESANLEEATSAILWGSVVNNGQSCLSLERVYVAESIFESFVEQLTAKAQRLKLAYPTFEDGQIGPIISASQAEIMATHLEDARYKGAKIHCGGEVELLEGGFWCLPTVLSEVNHSMKIMSEETFGPIMPVMAFSSVEEGIRLANDSIYGLSAAVFAASTEEALAVAADLEAGAISINDAGLTAFIHEGEKNSFKFSGLGGSRMGAAALQRFRRKKALLVKTQSMADPWWFK
ncbi:aldehyde dehydrogenase family protein [Gloeothece verrucosa]|uniref:Aldehyde Dehydrogenase n=1 Tax=Gloeothece verrucosa (strain PCC 7822) TaxID=497965 RepID=E0UA42_GLOV7|nr:aldehyde dehydrogenase family protein [Gloeothece verrucosa]ADN16234.1 Aldehyde Dehydrogenase [Gloeothece verrucosa PCC 7822]